MVDIEDIDESFDYGVFLNMTQAEGELGRLDTDKHFAAPTYATCS
jgi:hypothetical protein